MEIDFKIRNEKDWFNAFPPAGKEKQWVDNYSAKEFAKAVTNKNFEKEIRENLALNDSYKITEAYPERCTQFDEDYHGPRHHDMACVIEGSESGEKKKIALGFEAKVNESLDEKLGNFDTFSEGKKIRVNKLCKIFFNKEYDNSLADIYYQMLSGIAGTVAFAAEKECEECCFIIYQLKPSSGNQVCENTIEEHKNAILDFVNKVNMPLQPSLQLPLKIEKNTKIDLGRIELAVKEKGKIKTVSSKISVVYMEKEC